jgi:hypothetical protein
LRTMSKQNHNHLDTVLDLGFCLEWRSRRHYHGGCSDVVSRDIMWMVATRPITHGSSRAEQIPEPCGKTA